MGDETMSCEMKNLAHESPAAPATSASRGRTRVSPTTGSRRTYLSGCLSGILTVWLLAGCGYHHYAGPLQPGGEQSSAMTIADDGSVTYVQGRLEVRLRPVTDDELNRQFSSQSAGGPKATNPYTYGDTEFFEGQKKRQRFTVFSLNVKNYEYPKVNVDPRRIQMQASNKREYWSLSIQQMDNYFRAYAVGYRGNEYSRYRERRDLMQRTTFAEQDIFSGQEAEGLIAFPSLHPDVDQVRLVIRDLVLRFDYRNEPIEAVDLTYDFRRDVGRQYPDGTIALSDGE
jgi:hypothetical protein